MPELRALWEKHASQLSSFGKWLDDAEAGQLDVPGVREARALQKPKNEGGGPIITPAGVAGGRVIYLDDATRKPYEAKVTGGAITGAKVKNGEIIFVIGPDNKIYAGSKARANPGKLGAFNHSSFFSGGPVKSAGTLKVAGGKITEISDLSGHYTPSQAMVTLAVRKFAGKNKAWLDEVAVKLGRATVTGAAFLDEAHAVETAEIWGKYSAGDLSPEAAAQVLLAASDGNWLVRAGSGGKLALSLRQGVGIEHDLITNLGAKGLERKKLLLPKQVHDLLATVRQTAQPSGRESEGSETETEDVPEPVTEKMKQAAHNSPGWHGVMNSQSADLLIAGQAGAWLLRENKDGIICLSWNEDGQQSKHMLVDSAEAYPIMVRYTRRHATTVVRP